MKEIVLTSLKDRNINSVHIILVQLNVVIYLLIRLCQVLKLCFNYTIAKNANPRPPAGSRNPTLDLYVNILSSARNTEFGQKKLGKVPGIVALEKRPGGRGRRIRRNWLSLIWCIIYFISVDTQF